MKKFKKSLMIIIPILVLTVFLTACNGNDEGSATNETSVTSEMSIPSETSIPSGTNTPSIINVSAITLNKITLSLTVPNSETLIATVNPTDATTKTVAWSSSKPEFATVDANGLVTAVSAGTAIITVTSTADSTKFASCSVAVTAAPTPVDIHTDIIDVNSKFMLLSNSDEVNSGAAASFTLAANIGHSVDDAVVKYNGTALTKVDNSTVAYSSVKNAAKLMRIINLNEEEVNYVKAEEVKYVTYQLNNIPEDFDSTLLTVEAMTKTYKLILGSGGCYYTDLTGKLLTDGLYGYDYNGNPIYYVEVPLGKTYQFKLIAKGGYGFPNDDTIGKGGVSWYGSQGEYNQIEGTDFAGEFQMNYGTIDYPDNKTFAKSCVITIPPIDELAEFQISGNAYPDPYSPEMDTIIVAMGEDYVSAFYENRQRAISTGDNSYTVFVPQYGDLYLYTFLIGKYNPIVEIEIDGQFYPCFDAQGICYTAYGPITYSGMDIEVFIHSNCDGVDFTYSLLITSPKQTQEKATGLIDIQAGDAKYSLSNLDFINVAKATSQADLAGVNINGFTATYGVSNSLDTNHVILTANTACGITLDNDKALINIFIQQSDFYVQDFLWENAADFDDKQARIDVSNRVELTSVDGKLSIFYNAFGFTIEIIINI